MSPFFQDSLTTLYCGDSRVSMADMPQGLVVTDPPFNVGYHYAGYKDKLKVADYAKSSGEGFWKMKRYLINFPLDSW